VFDLAITVVQDVATAAAVAGVCAGVAYYAAVVHSAQVFGNAVSHGPGRRRSIALTFDDGPTPASSVLARYLEHEGIRATFFQCGANVARHAAIARDLNVAGHELGNHTYTHRRLCPRLGWKLNLLSASTIFREFAETQQAIMTATGTLPRLLRPPYGLRWRGVGAVQRKLCLRPVLWSVTGHDWEWPADQVSKHVLRAAAPGGIICLHDGRDTRADPDVSTTLNAVSKIVPRLKDLGYGFETVSEILVP